MLFRGRAKEATSSTRRITQRGFFFRKITPPIQDRLQLTQYERELIAQRLWELWELEDQNSRSQLKGLTERTNAKIKADRWLRIILSIEDSEYLDYY